MKRSKHKGAILASALLHYIEEFLILVKNIDE